tara:strand:+ start:1180 stop:1731 length:552 start_codon:yes stop_codon:yes gene_type:complete
MEKDKIETTAEITKPIYWQWIKGDESGNVITFKDEGAEWITFNEGGRIATELRDEFLQQLDSDIAGEYINTSNAIDPLNVGGAPRSTQEITGDVIIPALDTTPSPIRILFDKQKKNNKVKLILEFPINIPSIEIYDLMSTSFDSEEVNEELQSFILDQLSKDEISDCLFNSIISLIQSKYKGE